MDCVTLTFRLYRLSWQIKAQAVEASFRRFVHAFKYNPNQPRVPAGNPDGGQWTDGNGGGGGSGGANIGNAARNSSTERDVGGLQTADFYFLTRGVLAPDGASPATLFRFVSQAPAGRPLHLVSQYTITGITNAGTRIIERRSIGKPLPGFILDK
jgi:hypothetical protein